MEIFYTRRFLRRLKKLPVGVQEDVIQAVERFSKRENHEQIRLHKLSGRMKKYHAFSANYTHRIVVEIQKEKAYMITVGDHDVYR